MLLDVGLGTRETNVVNMETLKYTLTHISRIIPKIYANITSIMALLRKSFPVQFL